MRLDCWFCLCIQVVDDSDVGQIMQESNEKDHYDQAEEELVISFTDAIVEPSAVMVKVINTPVASAAMLRSLTDMCLANIAFVLIIWTIEYLPIDIHQDRHQISKQKINLKSLVNLERVAFVEILWKKEYLPLGFH